jgi:hypothetical protein
MFQPSSTWLLISLLVFPAAVTTYTTKYAHGLFENFEVTVDVFHDEVEMVRALRSKRSSLLRRRRDIITTISGNFLYLRSEFESKSDFGEHFGKSNDFFAAMTGVLVIYDTYNITVEDLADGRLPGGISTKEKLGVDDAIYLAGRAFKLNWLDSSVDFARAAGDMWKRHEHDVFDCRKREILLDKLKTL